MTEEELLRQASQDPVFWAEATLPEAPGDDADPERPLRLKWWQKDFLRHIKTRNRVTLRIRRQCGKSICLIIASLYYAMWTSKEIMIVCPQENQIVNFYEKLLYFIENTAILKSLVSGQRQQPFRQIYFSTGAAIKLIVAGKTGSGIRGQSADILILDECDELTDAAYKAVLPVVNNPTKKIFAGTTINGRRSYFYHWVHDSIGTWVDIWVNPETDPDFISYTTAAELGIPREESTEYFYRKELRLSDLAYLHEVCCIWADEITGVYKKTDIARALHRAEWSYEDYADSIDITNFPTGGPTFMGVDWDKFQGCGPQLCIVQCDDNPKSSTSGMLRVIWREEIPPNEFCLGEAVNRIIFLNDHFQCNKIYIDPGMGERQIEELRLYGVQHPSSGLREKVIRYHFKANDIKFLDPMTGREVSKNNKHWMIDTSRLYFEENRIALCPSDETLAEHLRGYTAHVTKSGSVSYSDKDEHTVDAFNLAVVAFDRELGSSFEEIMQGDAEVVVGKLPQSSPFDDLFAPDEVIVISESLLFSEDEPSWLRQDSRQLGRGLSGRPQRRQLTGFRRG